MRGLVVTRHGGAEVLEWRDVVPPSVGSGEVLVAVRAVAVDWADLLVREGQYPGGPVPPFLSGHNLAGEVVEVGTGVEGIQPGTRVFGAVPRRGVAADYVSVPRTQVYPIPHHLEYLEAAGIAGQFFTAEVALQVYGRFSPGESVLVHAAAGSYGSAAVQLCKALGAGLVVATAGSDEKVERVVSWGADVVINYTEQDFVQGVRQATGGRGVDIVLESVGGDVLARSFDCIAPLGRLVSIGASSGRSTSRFRLQTLFETGISVAGFSLGFLIAHRPDIVATAAERVLALLESKGITPIVGRVFPRAEAQAAHRYVQERRGIGRTVIDLSDGESAAPVVAESGGPK